MARRDEYRPANAGRPQTVRAQCRKGTGCTDEKSVAVQRRKMAEDRELMQDYTRGRVTCKRHGVNFPP